MSQRARLLKKAKDDANRERAAQKHGSAEWEGLQRRLTDAERALALAREQLAVLEVKLDILEGAANVLDARTRTAPQQQPGPTTGATV